mgnify:CR=1 FL=1
MDGARSASGPKPGRALLRLRRRSGPVVRDDGQTRASAVKAGGKSRTIAGRGDPPGPRQETSGLARYSKVLLAVIAGITDPADTGPRGRFKWQNRSTLEGLRIADRRRLGAMFSSNSLSATASCAKVPADHCLDGGAMRCDHQRNQWGTSISAPFIIWLQQYVSVCRNCRGCSSRLCKCSLHHFRRGSSNIHCSNIVHHAALLDPSQKCPR